MAVPLLTLRKKWANSIFAKCATMSGRFANLIPIPIRVRAVIPLYGTVRWQEKSLVQDAAMNGKPILNTQPCAPNANPEHMILRH